MQQIQVHKLPSQVNERALTGSTVVVIDALRATSTICAALAAGASEVVPFVEIADAVAAAEKAGRHQVLLGGERKGELIAGFDLGNSPAEYSAQVVGGRRVFMTTTNGTRAMQHARLAKRIVIASFLNLSAVVASIQDEPRVDILCAGTDGEDTLEDILCAGAIVDLFKKCSEKGVTLNEPAEFASHQWSMVRMKAELANRALPEQLALTLRETLGGRNCIEVGNGGDLPDCAAIDRLAIAPELDVADWRITIPKAQNTSR